ncbi:AAA family ATPase [Microbacterium sp. YY-03]|uniref:AAA family ATPase n=1 Tax=Microbacterium sp. YY-03 TaxID=3421636 RepID=UPI003D16DF91
MTILELSPFQQTLNELIRARHPLLLVETQEPERVLDAIDSLLEQGTIPRGRTVRVYSLTKGLHGRDGLGVKPIPPEEAVLEAIKSTDPTIFVFHDLHQQLGASGRPIEPVLVRALLDAAATFKSGPTPHTLIMVAPGLTLPPDLEKVVTVVDLPLPDAAEIENALETIVSANRDAIQVDLSEEDRLRMIQAAQGLTLWEADNAFARAIVTDRVLNADDIDLIVKEKQQTIRKSGLLEFIPPEGGFESIGGLDNLKKWVVKRDGAWLPEAEEWRLPAPKGLLITGIPGCGKSLTARCVSAQWDLPLLRLDVGRVFSGLVGSSEQNMRNALKLAEAVSPSILWIDEIEKGFGSVGGGGDSGTSQRVFGTFLTWMQEKKKPVFVVATANKIDSLPAEFLRKGRFDEIFFVDLPTLPEREEIWNLHLNSHLEAPSRAGGEVELSPATLRSLAEASEGYSGAEIEQAVIAACFEAFSERRAVSHEDLSRSIRNTVPLSVTQAEQITRIREWASSRAVAATSVTARGSYDEKATADPSDVASWRGGRAIEF